MLKDPECAARYEESLGAVLAMAAVAPADRLAVVRSVQEELKKLPQVPGICGNHGEHVKHHMAPGLYTRELFIPKDTFVIGKTHRHSHPVFFMQGKCKMWDAGAGTEPEIMEAPLIWTSVAGAKRVLYTMEDCIFATSHANPLDEQDIDVLEGHLIVPETELLESGVTPVPALGG